MDTFSSWKSIVQLVNWYDNPISHCVDRDTPQLPALHSILDIACCQKLMGAEADEF